MNITEYPRFPFLGSLEDGEPFEYLLLSKNCDLAEIAILNWFTLRVKLHKNQKINLYIPKLLNNELQEIEQCDKTVKNVRFSEEDNGDIYQISISGNDDFFSEKVLFKELIEKIPFLSSFQELICYLIKDSMVVKQGIGIYLKHLIPYFSRIGGYSSDEYVKLKKHFLLDVLKRVNDHADEFEKLHKSLKSIVNLNEIPIYIHLEVLREMVESEISSTLFSQIFSEKNESNVDKTYRAIPNFSISMYTNAIKNLEKRLFFNYNKIVVVYLSSLNNHS